MTRSSFGAVRVLPEETDVTLITDMAAAGALIATIVGASLRYDQERLTRITLCGIVLGGGIGTVVFLIRLAKDVL